MRPDPDTPLAAAARQRHELTRSTAIQALRELDRTGATVTFESVARHALLTELKRTTMSTGSSGNGIAAAERDRRWWSWTELAALVVPWIR